jgi:hypothetical protein
MVTIGDVFSVVSAIIAICVSAWAMMLAVTLLFTARAESARQELEGRPWKSFLIGLLTLSTLGVFSLGMIGAPMPAIKLAGLILSLGLLSIAAVGAGGLALMVGRRMQPLDPSLSAYRAVGRGAAILVAATLVPFVGWWVFGPIVLAASLGAGFSAVFNRAPRRLMEPVG